MKNKIFLFLVNSIIAYYVSFQYIVKNLDILLIFLIIFSLIRISSISFLIKKIFIKKSFIYILLLSIPGFIFSDTMLAIKLILYTFTSILIVEAKLFHPLYFLILIVPINILGIDFIDKSTLMFDSLEFYKYAPNFFVFLIATSLLLLKINPLIVGVVTFFSMSRWNIVSLLGSYSRHLTIVVVFLAFFQLFFNMLDTTLGLKQSSDNDRLNLLTFQLNTLDEYVFGKTREEIKNDIFNVVNFTTDSFEGLFFDAYATFGVVGFLCMIFFHFRLLSKKINKDYKNAALYVFAFSFFNPVIYSFFYFLILEFIIKKSSIRYSGG